MIISGNPDHENLESEGTGLDIFVPYDSVSQLLNISNLI